MLSHNNCLTTQLMKRQLFWVSFSYLTISQYPPYYNQPSSDNSKMYFTLETAGNDRKGHFQIPTNHGRTLLFLNCRVRFYRSGIYRWAVKKSYKHKYFFIPGHPDPNFNNFRNGFCNFHDAFVRETQFRFASLWIRLSSNLVCNFYSSHWKAFWALLRSIFKSIQWARLKTIWNGVK